mgnify:FL=1
MIILTSSSDAEVDELLALVPGVALPGDFEGVTPLTAVRVGVRDLSVVVGTVVLRGASSCLGGFVSVTSVGSMNGLSVRVIISLRSVTGVDGADDGAFCKDTKRRFLCFRHKAFHQVSFSRYYFIFYLKVAHLKMS